jgi:hypothetical protein
MRGAKTYQRAVNVMTALAPLDEVERLCAEYGLHRPVLDTLWPGKRWGWCPECGTAAPCPFITSAPRNLRVQLTLTERAS